MAACKNGHTECMKYLYSKGADINLVNTNDDTALLIAVRDKRHEIVRLLATRVSNLNHENKFDNLTPFMRSALH